MEKYINATAKDAMEVGKEYLEEDSIESAEPVVVVGKLHDEYVEVVEEEGESEQENGGERDEENEEGGGGERGRGYVEEDEGGG